MHRLASVVVVVAACSSSSPKSASTMPDSKADTGPTCAAMSDHVIDLLTKTQPDAPPDVVKKIRDTLDSHCEKDGWTASSRTCFAKMATKEEGNTCEDGLSEVQKKSLESEPDAQKESGSAPGGGTRGTPQKGGDPQDGGD